PREVHGPRRRKPGPLVTPIFASSTWALASARQGADLAVDTAPPAYYTRWGNPTVRELEDALADLEGGARALATGSGMGAIASAILTSVDRDDHVVAGSSLYTATTEIFTRLLPRFGIETTFVDPRRRGVWKESVRSDTRLVYVETPANATMEVQSRTAQSLAEFLEDRRAVRVVHYPGLQSFPQHALARKQMNGFGAMLSFELNGGYRAGKRFVEAVDIATLAVSLGGTETLV